MKRKTVFFILLLSMIAGCAALSSNVAQDPAKAALYGAKSEWSAVREYVIKESYSGRLSDVQTADFRKLDDRFSLVYNIALSMYLGGIDNQVRFSSNLDQLRDMLIEARRVYTPGGTK